MNNVQIIIKLIMFMYHNIIIIFMFVLVLEGVIYIHNVFFYVILSHGGIVFQNLIAKH